MTRHLSLALVATLCFAGSAHAIGLVGPISTAACGSLAVPSTLVGFGFFTAKPKCESHCKQTAGQCRKLVKKIAGCYESADNANAAYSNQVCGETLEGAEARMCKLSTKSLLRGTLDSLHAATDGYLMGCDDYGTTCATECSLP